MEGKKPYQHRSEGTGFGFDEESAELEHRDTARPRQQERNELNPAERNREKQHGPETHQDARIDPDPRFDETE